MSHLSIAHQKSPRHLSPLIRATPLCSHIISHCSHVISRTWLLFTCAVSAGVGVLRNECCGTSAERVRGRTTARREKPLGEEHIADVNDLCVGHAVGEGAAEASCEFGEKYAVTENANVGFGLRAQ